MMKADIEVIDKTKLATKQICKEANFFYGRHWLVKLQVLMVW